MSVLYSHILPIRATYLNYYRSNTILYAKRPQMNPYQDDLQRYLDQGNFSALYTRNNSMTLNKDSQSTPLFPEMERAGFDEKALRSSPFGKILFGILEAVFPVFKEPNW